MRFVAAASAVACVLASCSSFDDADDDGSAPADGGSEVSPPPADGPTDPADGAADASSLPPNVIVAGEVGISSLAIDATHVYWTTGGLSGHVARCPRAGCVGAPEVLASNQGNAKRVAVSGERVVWIADDTVRSVATGGGDVFSTTSGFVATAFVVIGTTVYVAYNNSMKACSNAFTKVCDQTVGGTILTTPSISNAMRFEADILVHTSSGLRRVLVPTVQPSSNYAESDGILTAAYESEIFYATATGRVRALPKVVFPPDGGKPREVAENVVAASAMVADVTNVYVVAESTGKVFRVPKTGDAGAAEIAAGLDAPRAIAVDTNDLYVAIAGSGQILRLAK